MTDHNNIEKAIDDGFEAVKGYIDRGFAIVDDRLADLEKWKRETAIEAEVERRIAEKTKPRVRVPAGKEQA